MSSADCLAMLKEREDRLVNRRESPAKVEELKKVRLAIAALEGRLRTRDESRSESRSELRSPSRSRGRRRSRSRSRSPDAGLDAHQRWKRERSEKHRAKMQLLSAKGRESLRQFEQFLEEDSD